jgi:hypothetical protein
MLSADAGDAMTLSGPVVGVTFLRRYKVSGERHLRTAIDLIGPSFSRRLAAASKGLVAKDSR